LSGAQLAAPGDAVAARGKPAALPGSAAAALSVSAVGGVGGPAGELGRRAHVAELRGACHGAPIPRPDVHVQLRRAVRARGAVLRRVSAGTVRRGGTGAGAARRGEAVAA